MKRTFLSLSPSNGKYSIYMAWEMSSFVKFHLFGSQLHLLSKVGHSCKPLLDCFGQKTSFGKYSKFLIKGKKCKVLYKSNGTFYNLLFLCQTVKGSHSVSLAACPFSVLNTIVSYREKVQNHLNWVFSLKATGQNVYGT